MKRKINLNCKISVKLYRTDIKIENVVHCMGKSGGF